MSSKSELRDTASSGLRSQSRWSRRIEPCVPGQHISRPSVVCDDDSPHEPKCPLSEVRQSRFHLAGIRLRPRCRRSERYRAEGVPDQSEPRAYLTPDIHRGRREQLGQREGHCVHPPKAAYPRNWGTIPTVGLGSAETGDSDRGGIEPISAFLLDDIAEGACQSLEIPSLGEVNL
jgi:hypothetical protein